MNQMNDKKPVDQYQQTRSGTRYTIAGVDIGIITESGSNKIIVDIPMKKWTNLSKEECSILFKIIKSIIGQKNSASYEIESEFPSEHGFAYYRGSITFKPAKDNPLAIDCDLTKIQEKFQSSSLSDFASIFHISKPIKSPTPSDSSIILS